MSSRLVPGDDAPQKSTLHCAVCGHAEPPDGDWSEATTTTETGERLVLSCPDCGATVTRRRPTDSTPDAIRN
ncbi:MAG: hypothetical protein ABEJ79_07860 [Halolamina sp.]